MEQYVGNAQSGGQIILTSGTPVMLQGLSDQMVFQSGQTIQNPQVYIILYLKLHFYMQHFTCSNKTKCLFCLSDYNLCT